MQGPRSDGRNGGEDGLNGGSATLEAENARRKNGGPGFDDNTANRKEARATVTDKALPVNVY